MMYRHFVFFFAFFLSYMISFAQAKELDVNIPYVLLIDDSTGTILYAKDIDTALNPGSLNKLMVASIIFDALKRGELSLDQKFLISKNCWQKGGAPSRTRTMFAAYNSYVSIENLLYGLTILGANDAAIALAEGFAGSEEKFLHRMNEEAKNMGLESTYFSSVTGLGKEQQKTTLRDLSRIMRYISNNYPDYYRYYHLPSFTWNKIRQNNKSPLAKSELNVEAALENYSETEGSLIAAYIIAGKRHLFLFVGGIKEKKKILPLCEKILHWGIENFQSKLLYKAGHQIGAASVFGGEKKDVGLILKEPLYVLVSDEDLAHLKAKIYYRGPLQAPVKAGNAVGVVRIFANKKYLLEKTLYTSHSVPQGSFLRRAGHSLYELGVGWMRPYRYYSSKIYRYNL